MEPDEEEGNALDQCEDDGQIIWPQTLVFVLLTLSTKAPAKQGIGAAFDSLICN